MIRNAPIITLSICLLAGSASAENLNIKPGLWEITVSFDTKGTPPIPAAQRAEMEKAMAKMSPEMRAKIEAATKNAQARSVAKKSCVTKEDLAKPLAFEGGKGDGACTRTILKSTSTAQEIRIDCANNTRKSSGILHIAAPNPETWTATMDGSMSDTGGATAMTSKMNGKWLGAGCGDVKK